MQELTPVFEFISTYGYWIAIPLMIIEGPVITMVMGFLASTGAVNIFLVILLGTSSDLISDTIYYYVGRHGSPWVLKKFEIFKLEKNQSLRHLKEKFETHPGKIFFSSKVLTGLAHSTFVLAGVTRINYFRILKYTIPGGIIWSTGLALIGYYFGKNIILITHHLTTVGIIFFALLILFLLYHLTLKKHIRRLYGPWKARLFH